MLLHGLAANGGLNWDPVIEPLAERFRVIALDHRGHGNGIRPHEPFALEDCADDVAALLDVYGVGRAVLVGYSMGGAIAQLTWQRHPRRVAGLVLLATAARFDVPPGSELLTRLLAEVDRHNGHRPGLLGNSATDIHHAVRSLADFDSRPWIDRRPVPATVLLTRKDRVVSPRLQRELAALVADGQTTELELGHLAVVLDRGAVGPAVREACAGIAAESGLGRPFWRRRPRRRRRRRDGVRPPVRQRARSVLRSTADR